jgi:tetratricopeptide (TPR) repeat protein
MKRKLKKKIKEDELASSLKWLTKFFKENQREILIGFSIVGIAVVLFFGYKIYSQILTSKDNVILGRFIVENSKISPEKLPSRWKTFGHLKLASDLYSQGKMEDALNEISKIKSSKRDIYYYQSLLLKGDILKGMGEFEKAIDEYKKITIEKPKNFPWELAILRMAICYKEMGKKEDAILALRRIAGEFPNSPYITEAEELLGRLQPQK